MNLLAVAGYVWRIGRAQGSRTLNKSARETASRGAQLRIGHLCWLAGGAAARRGPLVRLPAMALKTAFIKANTYRSKIQHRHTLKKHCVAPISRSFLGMQLL